jgi:hypothetical protein
MSDRDRLAARRKRKENCLIGVVAVQGSNTPIPSHSLIKKERREKTDGYSPSFD